MLHDLHSFQLSPFPFHLVQNEIKRFHGAKEITWAQEEPKNAGGWTYVQPRITTVIDDNSKTLTLVLFLIKQCCVMYYKQVCW